MSALFASDRGVTLIGGGAVDGRDMSQALALAPGLVAADGGADAALRLGHLPDAVIGDLDSLSPAGRAAIPAARLHRIAEQDSTDFTKCLTRIDAPFVLAVGFQGKRLDHTLAVLASLAAHPGRRVVLVGRRDVTVLCPPVLDVPLAPGVRVSLFPMGPARGHSTGLHWPIDGIDFAPAGRGGTSNRATGPVCLRISGPMLLILPRDQLLLLLRALGWVSG